MRLRGTALVIACLLLSTAVSAYHVAYSPTAINSLHQTGSKYGNNAWIATTKDIPAKYMTYGPYEKNYPLNTLLRVTFTLAIDNDTHDDMVVLRLDVNDASKENILTSIEIQRRDFGIAGLNMTQEFPLYFRSPLTNVPLEYRVYYACCSAVVHYATVVDSLDEGRFASFWNNQSHFEFVSKAHFPSTPDGPSGMNVGFDFVPLNGVWYLFHRQYLYMPQPSYCVADYARLVVRTSTDEGRTWSNLTVIIENIPNTPTECAVVDGAGYYDAETDTWHYLGQCMSRQRSWNMCHFTKKGSSPLGLFTPNTHNPVVLNGQLWKSICSGADKHCLDGTGDEGTPEIVSKDRFGRFYVTFHGWNPTRVKSARGVARTTDFVTWETSGFGLPGDAIFSPLDCNPWNIQWASGGCVGGGEGTILKSGDYMYHLIEAPDISLGCITTPNTQNWVLGLLRYPSFAVSGVWEQFMSMPTVVPVIKQGCFIQYHRLFQDDYGIYLEYWSGDWMHIFKLTAGGGPLPVVAGN